MNQIRAPTRRRPATAPTAMPAMAPLDRPWCVLAAAAAGLLVAVGAADGEEETELVGSPSL